MPARSLTPARVLLAWLMAIGVDLLLHAGLFARLFEPSREPALLPDTVLFRRIPVAYGTLLVGVVALAWILDLAGQSGFRAVRTGALGGLLIGVMGLGGLWTALTITGLFVAAGIVVLVIQGSAAAAVLASTGTTRSLTLRVVLLVIACFAIGQLAANLLSG